MKPILKWVGGKTQLLEEIKARLPKKYNDYYEAFTGGGAVIFNLTPINAHLNDFNAELINLYNVIKKEPLNLIDELKKHINEQEYFYKIRELDRNKETFNKLSPVARASRMIYLNKTCFNGLYRVNSKGEFNTPFGKYKNPLICDEDNIKAISQYLNDSNVEITNLDFEEALKNAKAGDFVYLDPPYDPLTPTSSFTSYNASGFSRNEQIRLKNLCDDLNKRGVKWMLSNSATSFIIELYKDYKIEFVKAKRCINSKGDARGDVEEVLIYNYDLKQ